MKDRGNGAKNETILVIEDDHSLRDGLVLNFELRGYRVLTAADGEEGMRKAFDASPDLIVLDIMLPGFSGLEILSELRARQENMPVLVLSARDTTGNKVEGLDLGADDYLTKPFNAAELLARVDALLRRSGRLGQPDTLEAGGIKLDLEARKVFVKGKGVKLWAKEFDLLALLVTQQGRVLSRDFLLQQVWDYSPGSDPSTKVVDVTVSHLREKLGAAAGKKVATVRGFGYRLDP